ncbi:MAG: hypothetical protein PHD48_07365 [Alphaproteobacteria bacterium]|nr:hypothetical protein [Alphaproteobacteria bacterium]
MSGTIALSGCPHQLTLPHAFLIVADELVGIRKVLRKYLERFIEKISACFCVQGQPFMTMANILLGNTNLLGALANATEHPDRPSTISRARSFVSQFLPK